MGIGAVLIFVGVALLSARPVPTLADMAGLARDEDRGRHRRVGPRQHDPQPTAHQSTASVLMIGLAWSPHGARGDHRQLQERRERRVHRGLRRHRPEQLLADPDRCRRGRHPGACGTYWRRARRPGDGVRIQRAAHRGQPDDRARRAPGLEARLAGGAGDAGLHRRLRRRRLRVQAPPVRWLAGGGDHADGRPHPPGRPGRVCFPTPAVRPGDDVGRDLGSRLLPTPRTSTPW